MTLLAGIVPFSQRLLSWFRRLYSALLKMIERVGFEQYCELQDSDLLLSASASNDEMDIFVYVKSRGDLILVVHVVDENRPRLRWIPWFSQREKRIGAMCLEHSGESLLVLCLDQSLFLIPALALVNTEDTREILADIQLLSTPFTGDGPFTPSAVAWWVRQSVGDESKHIAIVGSCQGQVVGFTIYTGTVLFSVMLSEAIITIEIATKPDASQVVMTSENGKQWRLILAESTSQNVKKSEDTLGRAFSALNISVLEDRVDAKQKALKTANSVKIDISSEQRVHCKKEAKLDVILHTIGNQTLLKVACNSLISFVGNIAAVQTGSSDQLSLHRLPDEACFHTMTNSFFFVTNQGYPQLLLVSRNLSLIGNDNSRTPLSSHEFKRESVSGKLTFEAGIIQAIHASTTRENVIVITDRAIYFRRLAVEPLSMVLDSILRNETLQEAEDISKTFGVDLQKMVGEAAGIKLAHGQIRDAKRLLGYTSAACISRLLRLTIGGFFREVLDLLNDSKPTPANKLFFNNLKVLLYAHEILKDIDDDEMVMNFRVHLASEVYDETQAVKVLTKSQLMSQVYYLVTMRGLQHSLVPALMALSPTLNANSVTGFWEVFTDPALTEPLMARPSFSLYHLRLVKKHLNFLTPAFLLRLEEVYDPYQPTLRGFFAEMCKGDIPKKEWLETYLLVCIHLSAALNECELRTLSMISYGHVWEVEQPRLPYAMQPLDGGYKHAFAILEGIAYGWGQTTGGCLGSGPTIQLQAGPKAVESLFSIKKYVISIACGGLHTVALTNDGVYTWGENKYGQLGIPGLMQSCYPKRVRMLCNFRIVAVAAGQYHSLALDDAHRVFSWGFGVHGQLGHGAIDDVMSPKIITALSDKGVFSICAGYSHSLFLDLYGRVWACGNNAFGTLGMGEMKKSTTPILIYGLTQPVSMISAGPFQNLALSVDGRLYQWGKSPAFLKSVVHSTKRRALVESQSSDQTSYDECTDHMVPTLVDTTMVKSHIVKVAVGNEHCALLTENGRVYTWGRNMDGQLGVLATAAERRTQNLINPTEVDIDAFVIDVSCGWDTTIVLDDEDRLWTWGAAHHLKGPRSSRLAGYDGVIIVNNKSRVMKIPANNTVVQPVPTILNVYRQTKEQIMSTPAKLPSPLIKSDWRVRMHFAIESLQDYYEPEVLIAECKKIQEHDAYSKLTFLSGDYATSATQKLLSAANEEERKAILAHYLSIEMPSDEMMKLLFQVINVWKIKNLSFPDLEAALWSNEIGRTKALITAMFQGEEELGHLFSSRFKFHLVQSISNTSSSSTLVEGVFDNPTPLKDVVRMLETAEEFINISHEQLTDSNNQEHERRFFSM